MNISSPSVTFGLSLALPLTLMACGGEPGALENEYELEAESSIAAAQSAQGQLIVPNTPALQANYRFGAKSWVRWAYEQAWSTGPILDQTGAACGQGQPNDVWFLAGTTGGTAMRSCTIPARTPLFFPLANTSCFFEDSDFPTAQDRIAFIDEFYEDRRTRVCALTLEIDGVAALPFEELNSALWTLEDNSFTTVLGPDNFASAFGFGGGTIPYTSTAGHYAKVTGFAPGSHHTLTLSGTLCDDEGNVQFSTTVHYDLTVGN
jgi:hypothetical protein